MDKEYFDNYDIKGGSYDETWLQFTIEPIDLMLIFDKLNIYINSVIDLGAADGRWLNELKEVCEDLRVEGIEIYKDIIPKSMSKIITNADCLTHNFGKFDLGFFNGVAYFTEKELIKLFQKISKKCKYFAVNFETWDTIHNEYPKGILPENLPEKTLRPYFWWVNFIYENNFDILYSDPFCFILKPSNSIHTTYRRNEIKEHKYNKNYIKNIEYSTEKIIVNNKVEISYNKKSIHIINAVYRDLISLQPFLLSLHGTNVIAVGQYDYFVPGWINKKNGNLYLVANI